VTYELSFLSIVMVVIWGEPGLVDTCSFLLAAEENVQWWVAWIYYSRECLPVTKPTLWKHWKVLRTLKPLPHPCCSTLRLLK